MLCISFSNFLLKDSCKDAFTFVQLIVEYKQGAKVLNVMICIITQIVKYTCYCLSLLLKLAVALS